MSMSINNFKLYFSTRVNYNNIKKIIYYKLIFLILILITFIKLVLKKFNLQNSYYIKIIKILIKS